VFNAVAICPDHTALLKAFQGKQIQTELSSLHAIGNLNIVDNPAIAFFGSVRCPDDIFLRAHKFAQAFQNARVPVVSGFHSPIEKECLRLLLSSHHPIIHCPARSLYKFRLSDDQRAAIAAQKLLLLSPFTEKQKRITATLADKRNQFVSAIARGIFISYANPGGKTEAFAKHLVQQGKTVITFNHHSTQNLCAIGAISLPLENLADYWQHQIRAGQ